MSFSSDRLNHASSRVALSLPNEVYFQIMDFAPDTIFVLRASSRALKMVAEDFLSWNKEEIFRVLTRPGVQPLLSRCAQNDNVTMQLPWQRDLQFHLSVLKGIRSLGVSCPDVILSSHEVLQFHDQIQGMQDISLQRSWERIRREMIETNPPLEGVPLQNAGAQEIRSWMHADANQAILQELTVLDLNHLDLSCVPVEIGMCTALQQLHLGYNRLTSLPEGLLDSLCDLKVLNLTRSQLISLPTELFRELIQLQRLNLSCNLLASLPEGLFRGLVQLRWLNLSDNQLAFLPRGLFLGLGQLENLSLYGNPHLLLFGGDLPSGNNLSQLRMMQDFFEYECRSAFARFYQLAAGGDFRAVRESIAGLTPRYMKNDLLERVWVEAGRPVDLRSIEEYAFASIPVFNRALQKYVDDNFELVSPGELCSHYNILRVIDGAMMKK